MNLILFQVDTAFARTSTPDSISCAFLEVHPSDVLHTQIKNNSIFISPTPSYGPRTKTDITYEKETTALASTREKWLGRKKHKGQETPAVKFLEKEKNWAADFASYCFVPTQPFAKPAGSAVSRCFAACVLLMERR